MITFMFGVLGSTMFWVVYFVLSVFAVPIILKYSSVHTFNYLVKNGEHYFDCDIWLYVEYTIAVFVFWPVFAVAITVWIVLSKTLWPMLRTVIIKAHKITPTVVFKKSKKEKEGEG